MSDDLLNDLLDLGSDDIFETDRTTYERAPFGMPGGKSLSVKHILPNLPKRYKWIDHFGGSGIVSFNVPEVPIMVYNDRYSGVVAFYRCLQSKRYRELIERLGSLSPQLSREEWIHARATWCTEVDDVERAAKWFYMVKNSVIGKGQSFARSTNSRPPLKLDNSLELFESIHHKLRSFIIENLDWRVCARDYDSIDAVHYFDPPYVGTDPGIYQHKFSRSDLNELLTTIGNLKGFVALSGYADPYIDSQSYWTHKITWSIPVYADVSAYTEENNKTRSDSSDVTECLWIKE